MRPNCKCGHGYEKHGWGTTGCNVCVIFPESYKPCLQYAQSFCECGHVWESHAVVDGKTDELVCPFCGKTCKHWRTLMEPQKSPDNGQIVEVVKQIIEEIKQPSKICSCGHPKEEHPGHDAYGSRYCRLCIKDNTRKLDKCCLKFEDNTVIEKYCKCGHEESEHEAGADHSWCNGCINTKDLPVKDCCKKFEESEYHGTLTTQDEPDCVCGHNYWMHGVGENDDETCTECYEDNNIPMHMVCKKYRPKTEDSSDSFDTINKAALSQIKDGTVPKVQPYTYGAYQSSPGWGYGGQGSLYTHCDHAPFQAFADKGMEIWCGTKSECIGMDVKPHITSFDVILNCSKTGSVLPNHIIPLPFGKKYTNKSYEIEVDWPDMGAPILAASFWKDLYDYLKKTKGKMLIFCLGGHGRTGTALACMLVAARWKHRDAKNWIWKNYCKKAIESKTQEKYIAAVEASLDELRESKKGKKNAQ